VWGCDGDLSLTGSITSFVSHWSTEQLPYYVLSLQHGRDSLKYQRMDEVRNGRFSQEVCSADLPETEQTMTATYADDRAILASHHNPITASTNLQHHLNQFETCLKRWRIKANENKSTQITFTLKRETCPAVT